MINRLRRLLGLPKRSALTVNQEEELNPYTGLPKTPQEKAQEMQNVVSSNPPNTKAEEAQPSNAVNLPNASTANQTNLKNTYAESAAPQQPKAEAKSLHAKITGGERYSKIKDNNVLNFLEPLPELEVVRQKHSVVVTAGGDKKYALINSLSEEEWNGSLGQKIKEQFPFFNSLQPIEKNGEKRYRIELGHGNFGIVRLGVELVNGEPGENPHFVVVKKTRGVDKSDPNPESLSMARGEYHFHDKFLKADPNLKGAFLPIDAAAESKNKKGFATVYHFADVATFGDGEKLIKELNQPKKRTQIKEEKVPLQRARGNAFVDTVVHQYAGSIRTEAEEKDRLAILDHITFSYLNASRKLCAANVYHHDTKPSNILLNNDGTLFISDFGAAEKIIALPDKLTSERVSYLSDKGYWAPELASIYRLQMLKESMLSQKTENMSDGEKHFHQVKLKEVEDEYNATLKKYNAGKLESWALGISLLQFYFGVTRKILDNGSTQIIAYNPDGAVLADYFKTISVGGQTNYDYPKLMGLVNKLPENVRAIIGGLLDKDSDRRFSPKEAYEFAEFKIEQKNIKPLFEKLSKGESVDILKQAIEKPVETNFEISQPAPENKTPSSTAVVNSAIEAKQNPYQKSAIKVSDVATDAVNPNKQEIEESHADRDSRLLLDQVEAVAKAGDILNQNLSKAVGDLKSWLRTYTLFAPAKKESGKGPQIEVVPNPKNIKT